MEHEFARDLLERTSGSNEISGNEIILQTDGPTAFDTWMQAIQAAENYIHFENYIIRDDSLGVRFRDLLVSKALDGVEVRVLYDWLGCWATQRNFWKPLRDAGVEVRDFNRPSLKDPYAMFQRDHRKLVVVDGKTAFSGGFCVGQEWVGIGNDPPWRDTGIMINGPAAAVANRAFAKTWSMAGGVMPATIPAEEMDAQGETSVWLIEGEPGKSRVLRTLALVAAAARERLWITDPYFVAPGAIAEALISAASAGVDVRVLVPANNNWPLVGSFSRAGYRHLLENGVRLFEWQGNMIHAKSSVADGLWSRIGSSNLNTWSLLGNWEIDVGVLDKSLAAELEKTFLLDLRSSSEVLLPGHANLESAKGVGVDVAQTNWLNRPGGKEASARSSQLVLGKDHLGRKLRLTHLVGAGFSLGEALAGKRILGREDRTVLGVVSFTAIVLAILFSFFPKVLSWSIAGIFSWLGIVTGVRVFRDKFYSTDNINTVQVNSSNSRSNE
ncbi:MAG: phospholipase D-like domain-containing protein [Gemmatimonadetes bacterium]|nr:phospholipase D-like domain-containing protein [Gemmatimonadota bacterium]